MSEQTLNEGYNKETDEIMVTLPKTVLIFYVPELWRYVPAWLLNKAIKRGKKYRRWLALQNRSDV